MVVALGLLLVGVVVAGVGMTRSATGDGPITKQRELQQLPEANLFYPGATLLGSFGNDYERGVWGSNSASFGHTLGADVGQGEVLAFYERELAARGWQKAEVGGVGTDESTVAAWRKEGLTLLISILRKNDPRNSTAINAYQTPYRLVLFPPAP
jgi:hypothetical protein